MNADHAAVVKSVKAVRFAYKPTEQARGLMVQAGAQGTDEAVKGNDAAVLILRAEALKGTK